MESLFRLHNWLYSFARDTNIRQYNKLCLFLGLVFGNRKGLDKTLKPPKNALQRVVQLGEDRN